MRLFNERIWKRVINKIHISLGQHAAIALGKEGHIHERSVIKNAAISGNIKTSEGTAIRGGVKITGGEVQIGKYTSINGPNTNISARINPVLIGNFCSIAPNVLIQEYDHDYARLTSYFISTNVFKEGMAADICSKGPVSIGSDVWIGAGCAILSGVTIGDGAVVGAGSVVSKDIPPFAIAAGNPARVIKYRFPEETIELLLRLQWWDWSIDKIRAHKELFQGNPDQEQMNEKLKALL